MMFKRFSACIYAGVLGFFGLPAQVHAQDDTFVFMSSQLACPQSNGSANCYLSSPNAAAKAKRILYLEKGVLVTDPVVARHLEAVR